MAAVCWLERLGCKRCRVNVNPAEYILKATALQDLDAPTKTKRLKAWAEAWKVERQQFLIDWVGFLRYSTRFNPEVLGWVAGW